MTGPGTGIATVLLLSEIPEKSRGSRATDLFELLLLVAVALCIGAVVLFLLGRLIDRAVPAIERSPVPTDFLVKGGVGLAVLGVIALARHSAMLQILLELLLLVVVVLGVGAVVLVLLGRLFERVVPVIERSPVSTGTVAKGGVGLAVLGVLALARHSVMLQVLLGLIAAAAVLGILAAGGFELLGRFLPSSGGGALPTHYGGLVQRSRAGGSSACPECGTANDRRATVCADCAAQLSTSRRRTGSANPDVGSGE